MVDEMMRPITMKTMLMIVISRTITHRTCGVQEETIPVFWLLKLINICLTRVSIYWKVSMNRWTVAVLGSYPHIHLQGDFFYLLPAKNRVSENADILVYFELVTSLLYLAMF